MDQYAPDMTLPANLPAEATAGNENVAQGIIREPPMIYDNVIKASNHTFLPHEHHVTQTENGTDD